MAICLLVRHGRTRANATGILAGWTPGIGLDETGADQARRLGQRLRHTPLAAVVASPLQRCQETATTMLDAKPQPDRPPVSTDERLGEARYGAWTGRLLSDLADEALWRQVQDHPSGVTFPPDPTHEHESMSAMRDRAVQAVLEWDARVEADHGPGAIWAAVSHGDVIKAILAEALAVHLDDFQRIVVDPASVSIVHRASTRPFVLRTNDTSTDALDLSALTARLTAQDGPVEADVGGGAGSTSPRS